MGCCKSHLLTQLQGADASYLERNPAGEEKSSRNFINGILAATQEEHLRRKTLRTRKFYECSSKEDYGKYIKEIVGDLKLEEKSLRNLFWKMTDEFASPEIDEQELFDDIQSYLDITAEDVTSWIKEKTEVVKSEGQNFARRILEAGLSDEDNKYGWKIFQVMIEDKKDFDKDFLLSVALEFLFEGDSSQAMRVWSQSLRPAFLILQDLQ